MQYPIIDLLADVSGESVKGKNLLNNTASSTIINGVTFTVNMDGSISCFGTSTSTAVFRIYQTFTVSETLTISGCPRGGSYSDGYSLAACDEYGTVVGYAIDIGNSASISQQDVSKVTQIQIIVRPNINVTGKTFFPMVRISSNTDASYEPYFSITFPQLSADDISHRLKLPMLKYYPHAVIEALQTVNNGETLSYEQYDVLKHYLTPLGIGGI